MFTLHPRKSAASTAATSSDQHWIRAGKVLAMGLLALLIAVTTSSAQTAYVGLYEKAEGAAFLAQLHSFKGFIDHDAKMAKQGLRLVDFKAVGSGKNQRFLGSYRAGGGKRFISRLESFDAFSKHFTKKFHEGLRCIDFETFVRGGKRHYVGVYRAGKGGAFISHLTSYQAFTDHFTASYKKGLRLIDFEAFSAGGKMHYVGVYRQGKGGNILAKKGSWDAFKANHSALLKKKLRLIDFDYFTTKGKRHYVGVYRSGQGAGLAIRSTGFDAFKKSYQKRFKKGFRLRDIEVVPAPPWSKKKPVLQAMNDYRKKSKATGLSVAIVKNGDVLFCDGVGWEDKKNKKKAGPNTVYRLASISKPIAATLAMRLVDQGKLDLTRDARFYAPNFPKKKWSFTVRDLMCHFSGIRHYRSGSDPLKNAKKEYATCKAAIELFKNDPLRFKPRTLPKDGSRPYSTPAFTVLGYCIETAAKKSFKHYLEALITNKYGFKTFRMWNPKAPVPHISKLYASQSDQEVSADRISWKGPGGGTMSSAPDLAKFTSLVMRGGFVSKKSLKKMWTRQIRDDGSVSGFGLGWGVGSWRGKKVVAHSGSQRGSATYLRAYPDHGYVVVVLSNTSGHKPKDLANTIDKILFPSS